MNWGEIRQKARRVVHDQFQLPAVYTAPGVGGVVTPCHVRMHNEMKVFGDLDREGFAFMADQVNRIVFDTTEVVPEKHGVIEVTGFATYNVVNIMPETTNEFLRTEVTLA